MTEEQMKKSQWLGRLHFIKQRLNSLYSLKERDKAESELLLSNIPEKYRLSCYEQCSIIAESIIKRSAEKYIEMLELYNNVRMEIESAINSIDNYEYQSLLSDHYIEGKNWETIAEEIYFSPRTVKYKHLKALDCLDINIPLKNLTCLK